MEDRVFKLEAEEELRVEVDCGRTEKVSVELKTGHAEIFGTELVANTRYQFSSGAKFAIFTYQGCTVHVSGTNYNIYSTMKKYFIFQES